jgi:rhodanese-related sulfurtransferase
MTEMRSVKRVLAATAVVLAVLAVVVGTVPNDNGNLPQRTQRTQRTTSLLQFSVPSVSSVAHSTSNPSVTATQRRRAEADLAARRAATDLAAEIEHEDDHVTALELAQWIRDRKPGLRVLDVRTDSEYSAYHIPSAERMPLTSLATLVPNEIQTLVLYSEGGAHAAQGWVLLRATGHRNVYFLRGGLLDWMEDVMSPALPADSSRARVAALSRYFGGTPHAGLAPLPVRGAVGSRADKPTATTAASAVARLRRRGC